MDTAKLSIAYAGNFHAAWNTESHVARGFESLGHSVTRLGVVDNDHDSILAAAKELRPDILLGAKWGFKGADGSWPGAAHQVVKLIEACRPYIGTAVCHHWDCVCEEFSPARWQWQQLVSAAVDLTALTDGTAAQRLPKCVVVRDGCPDDVDDSVPFEPTADVLFLGTAYGDRPRLIDALSSRFGERFTHVSDGVTGADLTRLIRSHRIVVGPHYPRFAHYWSDRLMIVTGHGGLFAAPSVPGMESDGWVFSKNYLALPTEPASMAAKVEEYLRCDAGQLETIRRNGHAHAQKNCSWEKRVGELLGHLAARGLPRPLDEPGEPEEPTELEPPPTVA